MKQTNLISKNLWIFIIILFLIGLVTGIIGFMQEGQCFSGSIYSTIQTFALHHEFKGDIASRLLEYSRWILLLAFVAATFKLFFILIAPKWLQSRISRFPGLKLQCCLFAGAGEQAKILAKDLKKKSSCRCIFLVSKEKENDNALYDELRDLGAFVLYVNFEDDKMKFPKVTDKFFFVDEDEQFNMKMSARLVNKIFTKEINVYVKTESKQFFSYIEKKLKKNIEGYKNIEFHIFNQSDLTARLFVKENPMLNSPNIKIENLRVKGDFNVLLLGFGWQGQELLKKCVCDSQFVGSTFKATIFDSDFETHHGDYPVLYDECIEHYNLNFKSDTVGSKKFYEWLDTEIANFNRIIIALGNDEFNINTAEKITEILHKHGILNTKEIVFACVLRLKPYSNNFKPFGKLTKIYTEEMIVNAVEDKIAKMVNYVYNHSDKNFDKFTDEDRKNIEIEWKPISLFNKDSSRAVAQNIENIKKIAGEKIFNPNKAELEILAENEHLRWNAFHFVNGIREWHIDEINTGNAKLKDKTGNLLKHGCLVPLRELNKVSAKVNEIRKQNGIKEEENFAETDRRIVRHFPVF